MSDKSDARKREKIFLEKRIETFCIDLQQKQAAIIDVLDDERDKVKNMLSFSLGIEVDGLFRCCKILDGKWTEGRTIRAQTLEEKYRQIANCFDDQYEENKIFWLRCIGGAKNIETENGYKASELYVYYYIVLKDSKTDPMFLEYVEIAYYEWISKKLSAVLDFEESSPNQENDISGTEIKDLRNKAADEFCKGMREFIGIDIEFITTLSTMQIERENCKTRLIYLMDKIKDDAEDNNSIEFSDSLKMEISNIKQIRKILQMGKDHSGTEMNQGFLLYKENNAWELKDLYKIDMEKMTSYIMFEIVDRMVWNMEVCGKRAVSFKYGKFVLENKMFDEGTFAEIYNKVFGTKINDIVSDIFKEAAKQEHGTILIIIKDETGGGNKAENNVKCEVNRLLEVSSGTRIEPREMDKDFIISLTSIDGALVIDDDVFGYGFGMILDGINLKGDPARGARYNSTRRYMKRCQKDHISAIGVVFSEDKNINIISTIDDFGEE